MRWLVAATVVTITFLAAGACSATPDMPSSQSGSAIAPTVDEIVDATTEAGSALVAVRVDAVMPSDFDDGVPERSFGGTGIWEPDRDLAGIKFQMGAVPNAAGYFGHIAGALSVYYDGPRYVMGFRRLAKVLPGNIDWLGYDLSVLSNAETLRLGIGQLREIGLSDPRLAVSLLSAATGPLRQASPAAAAADTRSYTVTVDVADAASDPTDGLSAILNELVRLGVTSVDLDVDLAPSEDLLARLSYSLSYPPAEGSQPVTLGVAMRFKEYNLEQRLTLPRRRWTASLEDYLSP